jgi:hypothetical protein
MSLRNSGLFACDVEVFTICRHFLHISKAIIICLKGNEFALNLGSKYLQSVSQSINLECVFNIGLLILTTVFLFWKELNVIFCMCVSVFGVVPLLSH